MPECHFHGRRRPYTVRGVRRRPCSRCGVPARFQWSACANGNRYVPLCPDCDIALNRLALHFMRVPNADALLAAYEVQMAERIEDAE